MTEESTSSENPICTPVSQEHTERRKGNGTKSKAVESSTMDEPHIKCFKLSPTEKNPNSSDDRTSSRRFGRLQILTLAQKYDEKNVGLGEAAAGGLNFHGVVEEHEMRVREQQRTFLLSRFFTTMMASFMVFIVYLITLETVLSCALCVGLTIFWYQAGDKYESWNGSSMDWVVLGFAVVTPLTVTITLAFQRRERALYEISRIRSFCFQTYLAHAIWDWKSSKGREATMTSDKWLKHTDKVLEQLVGIGDELSRFLTLPTSSRSYHRMIKSGRRKAANIVEVAYRILDSFSTRRIVKLSKLTEQLKGFGLSGTEASRLRQYERYIGEAIENLRMIKMYRTPQALRSFGRIFTLALPAFYAPAFAQLAIDLQSVTMGILFAILAPLILTALFEAMQLIEDPFVGWVSLDGIDVNEEMHVLHFHQLISARNALFPTAPQFDKRSKAAIASMPMSLISTGMNVDIPRHVGVGSNGGGGSQCTNMDGSNRMSHFTYVGEGEKPSLSASARSYRRTRGAEF